MRSSKKRAALPIVGWLAPGWLKSTLFVLCAALLILRHAHAQSAAVPPDTQTELLAKLVGFDRNFKARAGQKVVVLLVAMPGNADSTRSALEMRAALERLPKLGDLPHEEQIFTYSSAGALVDTVRSKRAAIVYFGPGFEKQIPALRDAFASVNVLTVAAVSSYVPSGTVLGFDLVSGRPKLLVNVDSARRQGVSFPASVLKLMKVYP
jgi:hypothetical protein